MKNPFRRILLIIIIIPAFYSSIDVKAEENGEIINKDLLEFRLNLLEESLNEKADKQTLDNGVIKTLETERLALISDRDFYQTLVTITIAVLGLFFAIYSAVNFYRIYSTKNAVKESKDAKGKILNIKSEVESLSENIKKANEDWIKESEEAKNEILNMKNEVEGLSEDVRKANEVWIKDSERITTELIEEKQNIKDQINSFNSTLGSLEDSLKRYVIHNDSDEFLSEVKGIVQMLDEVAAGELDSNTEKVIAGKLKDKEVNAIEIGEEEI